jgi:hypothetical protein
MDTLTLQEKAEICKDRMLYLSSWECDFVEDMNDKFENIPDFKPSEKQTAKLEDLYEKVRGYGD